MIERWNPEYEKGYFKACLDIKDWFERFGKNMTAHRHGTMKFTVEVLKEIVKGHDIFMRYGGDVDILTGVDAKGNALAKLDPSMAGRTKSG